MHAMRCYHLMRVATSFVLCHHTLPSLGCALRVCCPRSPYAPVVLIALALVVPVISSGTGSCLLHQNAFGYVLLPVYP